MDVDLIDLSNVMKLEQNIVLYKSDKKVSNIITIRELIEKDFLGYGSKHVSFISSPKIDNKFLIFEVPKRNNYICIYIY